METSIQERKRGGAPGLLALLIILAGFAGAIARERWSSRRVSIM